MPFHCLSLTSAPPILTHRSRCSASASLQKRPALFMQLCSGGRFRPQMALSRCPPPLKTLPFSAISSGDRLSNWLRISKPGRPATSQYRSKLLPAKNSCWWLAFLQMACRHNSSWSGLSNYLYPAACLGSCHIPRFLDQFSIRRMNGRLRVADLGPSPRKQKKLGIFEGLSTGAAFTPTAPGAPRRISPTPPPRPFGFLQEEKRLSAAASAKLVELEEHLEAVTRRNRELEEEIARLQSKVRHREDEKQRLQRSVQDRLDTLVQEKEDLQSRFDRALQNQHQLKQERQQHLDERNTLFIKISTQDVVITEQRAMIADLRRQVEQAQRQIQSTLSQLATTSEASSATEIRLRREIEQTTATLSATKASLDTADSRNGAVLSQLQAQVEEAKKTANEACIIADTVLKFLEGHPSERALREKCNSIVAGADFADASKALCTWVNLLLGESALSDLSGGPHMPAVYRRLFEILAPAPLAHVVQTRAEQPGASDMASLCVDVLVAIGVPTGLVTAEQLTSPHAESLHLVLINEMFQNFSLPVKFIGAEIPLMGEFLRIDHRPSPVDLTERFEKVRERLPWVRLASLIGWNVTQSTLEIVRNHERQSAERLRESGDCVARANALLEEGKNDSALPHCNRAVSLNPMDPTAYLTRAKALVSVAHKSGNKGAAAAAITDLSATIELAGPSSAVLELRGDAHKLTGAMKEAINDFTQAITMLDVPNARLLVRRSECYSRIGQHQTAWEDVTGALTLEPVSKDAAVLRNSLLPIVEAEQRDLAKAALQELDKLPSMQFNKANQISSGTPVLELVAKIMKQYPVVRITIQVSIPTARQPTVAIQRAEACRAALGDLGVDTSRLDCKPATGPAIPIVAFVVN
eukprot:TRINITY_DN3109_c0_g1_i1.p1 TRINITY_DN3109_c0_g1~~TRINITY_DN3109_c0_g1_i1.p1  ORF type:complete len:870 (-),score=98.54 TRINITY_DN3109_c0_g1_i1:9-2618(-)